MLADMTVSELLEKTAEGTPVPGGGSLSAMAAAVGAALAQMVAGLTAGRKAFAAVTPEMNELAEKARRLRRDLLADMDLDAPDAEDRIPYWAELWPSAEASHVLPIPHGPVMSRLRCSAIQRQVASCCIRALSSFLGLR